MKGPWTDDPKFWEGCLGVIMICSVWMSFFAFINWDWFWREFMPQP